MLRKFLSPVLLFYLGLVLILYVGTYGQLMRNYRVAPQDRYYYGGEEYPLDETQNIAHIREGYEGENRAFFNITTDYPQKPSILKFEYILIGKLARVFSIDPVDAFNNTRFVLSVGWFILLYVMVMTLFHKKWQQLTAFAFILFGTSIYIGQDSFVHRGVFDAQVLFRFTYAMPHYLLGGLTAMISLLALAKTVESSKWRYWFIGSILAGMWSAFIYGPTIVLILGSMPVTSGILFWQVKRGRLSVVQWKKRILFLGLYSVFLALPLLYVRFVVAIQWKDLNLNEYVEKLNPFRLAPLEYFYSLGFVYVLSLVSLPSVLKKNKFIFILLYGWNILHPLGLYVLSDLLDLNAIRFYLLPYYVVFGLLAVLGIETILEWIPSRKRIFRNSILLIASALILVPSFQTLYHAWKRFELCYCFPDNFSFAYPQKDIMDAMWWLRDHTENSDVVLSDFYAGTLIPSFAGNLVFTSWWYRLSDVPQVHTSHDQLGFFFYGGFSDEDAQKWLHEHNISYIFYGAEERSLSPWKGEPTYSSLEEVARFHSVVLYKVKK